MKIAWVADFIVKTYIGGAQYTNEMYIKKGKELGFSIDVITPDDIKNDNYDLYILNNIQVFYNKCRKWLLNVIDNKDYILFSHDYFVSGNFKNFKNIFKNALLNLFLTKAHMFEYLKYHDIGKADYNTSPIDTEKFKISNSIIKDDKLAIWIGNMHKNKGLNNLLKFAKEKPEWWFKLFGKLPKNVTFSNNIEVIGEVEQNELVKWYQKARYFIALPNWIEPFGRSVVEAYLCGCDLIVNDRIGVIQENWDWNNYDSIKKNCKTEKRFWEKVKNAIK